MGHISKPGPSINHIWHHYFGFHFLVFTFFFQTSKVKSWTTNRSRSAKHNLNVYPPGNLTHRYQKWPISKKEPPFPGPIILGILQVVSLWELYVDVDDFYKALRKKPDLATSSSLPLQMCWLPKKKPSKNRGAIDWWELKSSNIGP